MDNAKVHLHGRLRLMTRRDPTSYPCRHAEKQIFPLLTAASMSSTDIETRFEALLKFVPDFIASQRRTVRRKRTLCRRMHQTVL
jgi:hypothetical protein